MKFTFRIISIVLLMAYGAAQVVAQDGKNEFNPVETGVTSLGIAPDARGASMGDLGAATELRCKLAVLEPVEVCLCIQPGSSVAQLYPVVAETCQRHFPCRSFGILQNRLVRQSDT